MMIYRILEKESWDEVEDKIPLAPIDIQDGYIHLSTVDSVLDTANLYFPKDKGLVVLVFDSDAFGDALRWEYVESRGMEFPHVYAECLRKSDVSKVVPLVVKGAQFVWGSEEVR